MQYAMAGTEPERMGNRSLHMAPHGCFPCAGEDAWVSIACRSDAEWRALARHIDPVLAGDGRFASLADRKANEDALEEVVAGWTAGRDRWEVTRLLPGRGHRRLPDHDRARHRRRTAISQPAASSNALNTRR